MKHADRHALIFRLFVCLFAALLFGQSPDSAWAAAVRRCYQKEPPLILGQSSQDNLYPIVRDWQRLLDAQAMIRLVSPQVPFLEGPVDKPGEPSVFPPGGI